MRRLPLPRRQTSTIQPVLTRNHRGASGPLGAPAPEAEPRLPRWPSAHPQPAESHGNQAPSQSPTVLMRNQSGASGLFGAPTPEASIKDGSVTASPADK